MTEKRKRIIIISTVIEIFLFIYTTISDLILHGVSIITETRKRVVIICVILGIFLFIFILGFGFNPLFRLVS